MNFKEYLNEANFKDLDADVRDAVNDIWKNCVKINQVLKDPKIRKKLNDWQDQLNDILDIDD